MTAGAQEAAEEKKAGKRYKATLFNAWGGPDLFTKGKDGYLPLKPAKYSYTQPYKYADSVIELYTKGVSAEGEEVYLVAMSVPVATSIEEPLLVLAWDRGAKKPHGKVIEFSPKKFKYGSYQIANFSSLTIGGYVGSKKNKVICKPNSEAIAKFNLKEKGATPIVLYTSIGGQTKKVFGTITMHRDSKRAIYLLYAETNNLGQPVFRSIVIVDHARAAE